VRIDTLVFGPLTAAQARHLIQERRRAAARTGRASATA
jgi:hypothetical protein